MKEPFYKTNFMAQKKYKQKKKPFVKTIQKNQKGKKAKQKIRKKSRKL